MNSYILAIAGSCLDRFYESDSYPSEGDFSHARYLNFAVGGCPLNMAAVCAGKGIEVKMLDMLKKDESSSDIMISEMRRYGIDTSPIQFREDVTNSEVIIILHGKKRTMFVVDPQRPPYQVDEQLQQLLNNAAYIYSLLHIINRSFADPEPLLKARKQGSKIIIDGSSFYEDASRIALLYSLCDGLFINRDSYARLQEHSPADPREIIFKNGGEFIIVTDGENGSTLYLKDQTIHKAALKNIDVIDSTGAGDSFAAAFLSALIKGYDYDKALSLATLNGAYACTVFGGQGGVCDFESLIGFGKEHAYEI